MSDENLSADQLAALAAEADGDDDADTGGDKGQDGDKGNDGAVHDGKGQGGDDTDADWRTALPDDLKAAAKNWNSPTDAVKTAVGLRQKLTKSVLLPGEDATDEDMAEFRAKLGIPEKPDGYEIKRPKLPEELDFEGADEYRTNAENEFAAAMHAVHASPAAVQAAVDWYYGLVLSTHQDGLKAVEAANDAADKQLRVEWGDEFEKNIALAQRAAKAMVPEALMEKFDKLGISADADAKRFFATLGRQLGEHDVRGDELPADQRQTLEERAEEIQQSDDYWTNPRKQREVRQIFEQLHGTAEIGPGAASSGAGPSIGA